MIINAKFCFFLLQTLFNIVSTSTYALLLLSSKQKTFFKTNIEKTTKAFLLTTLPKKKWKRCVFLTSHENKSPQKSCEWKANQIKIVKEKTSKSDSVVRFTTIRWTLLSLDSMNFSKCSPNSVYCEYCILSWTVRFL